MTDRELLEQILSKQNEIIQKLDRSDSLSFEELKDIIMHNHNDDIINNPVYLLAMYNNFSINEKRALFYYMWGAYYAVNYKDREPK